MDDIFPQVISQLSVSGLQVRLESSYTLFDDAWRCVGVWIFCHGGSPQVMVVLLFVSLVDQGGSPRLRTHHVGWWRQPSIGHCWQQYVHPYPPYWLLDYCWLQPSPQLSSIKSRSSATIDERLLEPVPWSHCCIVIQHFLTVRTIRINQRPPSHCFATTPCPSLSFRTQNFLSFP